MERDSPRSESSPEELEPGFQEGNLFSPERVLGDIGAASPPVRAPAAGGAYPRGVESGQHNLETTDAQSSTPAPGDEEGISVVVCNYNGEDYLPRCLDAILEQENVQEVIVADDASTDGSLELLRRRYPQVRVLALETNRGPGAARNAGLRAARQPWVLAVDNDAVLLPDTLSRLLEARVSHPEAAALQPRSVVDAEPDRVHYDAGGFHYVGLLSLRNFFVPLAEAVGEGVVEVDALIGIAPLVRREVLLSVGGYDEDLFYLAEDFDLALRLRLAGHRLYAVEEALVRHRGGTAGLSFREGGYPARRAYLHARNRWILMAKCYGLRTLCVALPGILLYELVFTVFALMEGNLGAHLRGKRDFFRSLGATRAKRREVQAARCLSDRELLVGGPLTLTPALLKSAPRRLFAHGLSGLLRAWWWCARPFAT